MESISVFEMIKPGIGPSSSHTMGPWKAAQLFIELLKDQQVLYSVKGLRVFLYGALAKTGKGHGTDVAILMGLCGKDYKSIDRDSIFEKYHSIQILKQIELDGTHALSFDPDNDLIFNYTKSLDFHPNGMIFQAMTDTEQIIQQEYYSIGGGFIQEGNRNATVSIMHTCPYPCHHAYQVIEYCKKLNLTRFSDLVYLNERAWRSDDETNTMALAIWQIAKQAMFAGAYSEGILPGGLNVKRRAYALNQKLLNIKGELKNIDEWIEAIKKSPKDFTTVNKWVSCFALAVNEENASFGKIVTSPTNGACGVLPAVLMYAHCFTNANTTEDIIRFILVAGEVGTLFKKNATISAAMGGCQAEIGVSSAMSAAGLTEVLGGSPSQVLMAAEIAMEHHLGLTCDPIDGLVQIPCIERNTMGAIKAITAANIALESDPAEAKVSLDSVISTLWRTSLDMNEKYKETSEGGLAITVGLADC